VEINLDNGEVGVTKEGGDLVEIVASFFPQESGGRSFTLFRINSGSEQ